METYVTGLQEGLLLAVLHSLHSHYWGVHLYHDFLLLEARTKRWTRSTTWDKQCLQRTERTQLGKPVRQADLFHGLVLSFGYCVDMQVFPHLSHVGFPDESCPGTSRGAAVQRLF